MSPKIQLLALALSFAFFKPGFCEPIHLLDNDLSKFEVWLGVPHSDIEGLPEGTYQSDEVTTGEPIGLDRQLKNIFSTYEEDGEVILRVSGEIYGALSTLEEYENYHLSVEFRWGEKKWPPRLNQKRDSGILYHAYGAHGRFWEVWKTCLEYQVQETDLGDFISLSGNTAKPQRVAGPSVYIRGDITNGVKRYNPDSETYFDGKGYIHAGSEHDAQHGGWNLLEIYTIGNDAIHLVNGHVVMVVEDATRPDGTDLAKGYIQLQSEAAECYYKNFVLTPIKAFPSELVSEIRFRN